MILRGRKARKEKQVKALEAMQETGKEFLTVLIYTVRKELGKVAVLLQILVPVLISLLGYNIGSMIVLSVLLTVVVKYVTQVAKKLNNQDGNGIPIPPRRFTKEDEYGFVGLQETDAQEAVLYLSDLEDYFISKGMLKEHE